MGNVARACGVRRSIDTEMGQGLRRSGVLPAITVSGAFALGGCAMLQRVCAPAEKLPLSDAAWLGLGSQSSAAAAGTDAVPAACTADKFSGGDDTAAIRTCVLAVVDLVCPKVTHAAGDFPYHCDPAVTPGSPPPAPGPSEDSTALSILRDVAAGAPDPKGGPLKLGGLLSGISTDTALRTHMASDRDEILARITKHFDGNGGEYTTMSAAAIDLYALALAGLPSVGEGSFEQFVSAKAASARAAVQAARTAGGR